MTKWLTEDELRRQWDDSAAETFQLEPGTSVTPAAREFLMDRRAALYGDPKRSSSPSKKPEHMTALRGSVLVRKDHPVIRFRGEIDALEAAVIESAFVFQRLGLPALAQEMEEILQFLRQVLRCEVLSLPLPEIRLLGMTEEDIHIRSHEPKRFYGLGHFSPAPQHGSIFSARLRGGPSLPPTMPARTRAVFFRSGRIFCARSTGSLPFFTL